MTEDEMVGWHHRLNGHEFEQTPGIGDGQGSLTCCSPWGRKESDTTYQKQTFIMVENYIFVLRCKNSTYSSKSKVFVVLGYFLPPQGQA